MSNVKRQKNLIVWKIVYVEPASLECVEKVAIIFVNPIGKTTPNLIFCTRTTIGYSPRYVSPALFRARVAQP